MTKLGIAAVGAVALTSLLGGPAALAQLAPHTIVSISVCAPDGASGAAGSCPAGTLDTWQPVLAPGGVPVNAYGGLTTLADEHSSILPPGTLPGHEDYLLFVATRTGLNPVSSGVTVLSGGAGPDEHGQWTLDFAADFGLYDPGSPPGERNGQLLLSPLVHHDCPTVASAGAQDPTFDLNYADPGSVVLDPSNPANTGAGNLLMVYEGTNRCIGLAGGDNVKAGNGFYSTVAVATSADHGHSWPAYRYALGAGDLPLYPLPGQDPTAGPEAPSGALGDAVCIGNDCGEAPWPPDPAYGRYAVLRPPVTIGDAMASPATANGLTATIGDTAPSAFVDDVAGGGAFLYEVHNAVPGPAALGDPPLPNGQNSDLTAARARLDGGSSALEFQKWHQGSFSQPGLGGLEDPILPAGRAQNCEGAGQLRTMGSISYVDETRQYLLTFVCIAPNGDPLTGAPGPGAAWFYSTSTDLSRQDGWSPPREILGSWSAYDPASPSCGDYNGWYPSFMSLGRREGHLATSGYVFYLKGCSGVGDATPGGRQYATRAFTITTARPARRLLAPR